MFQPEDHVVDHVDAYLHDVLSADDARYVERHCQECRVCGVALEEARRRLEAMQALPPVEAPDGLINRTWQRIDEYRPPWITPARVGWLTAAAAILLVGCLHLYYLNLSPTPYDLRLLGQSDLIAGSEASLRVVLVDHRTGSPLADVPVEIELVDEKTGDGVRLAAFATDRFGSGTPRMQWPDWADGQYELRVNARPGSSTESLARTVKLKRSWKLMVSTDKPVYQPGQTIHVRALGLRRPDLKPVAGHEASFSVTDPKGNVIFRRRDVTSRYGITSADCPLADEIIEGVYKIECRLGDTTGSVAVEVKHYVLPKFKIDVALDEPFYQPGQKVRGTVRVDYFFGQPVKQGQVEIAARATDVDATTFGRVSTRTDDQGKAAFEVQLPPSLVGRPQDGGAARIAVDVTVRDSAGQAQSRTVSSVVTAEPIRIEVIPEAGTLVPGVANTVYLFTSYPDGRPAQTRIVVSGREEELHTNSLGVVSIQLTPKDDKVSLTARATDEEGRSCVRTVTLESRLGGGDFLVRTDRAVYDGGQTVKVLALGGGVEPVFLDLIKDGQTMLTEVVPMDGGRGQYELDLPPELFGTIELCAYRFDRSGMPVRKTRAIYVRQPGELKIKTSLDYKEYRPGDRAKLTFTLTDAAGRPVPGALSLAAVDEAVYSVLSQAPGTEQTFFTLEQEILKPIYAIYDWTPDTFSDVPAAERDELERALFARTTLAANRPGREAILQQIIDKYAEGDRRLLEVLQRPDWEELAETTWMPEEMKTLLRSQDSSHSLRAMSFTAKVQAVEVQRRHALEQIKIVWTAFAVIGGLTLLFIVFRENLVGCLLAVVIAGVLVSLMLPAVQSAREASRRMSSVNDLKQLGLAFQNFRDAGGKIPTKDDAGQAAPPRVRQWFPETLLWRPELVTDEQGRASLEVDLADSITTWRLAASAVSAGGKLGAARESIRVFQPFFVDLDLPVALTRGDEVAVPVVVYNYLDAPQTVELKLAEAAWLERLDDAGKKLELAAGEVRSVSYRIRAKKVGRHELEVEARGGKVADAIKRQIEVVPDGRRVEQVSNGTLDRPAAVECSVPKDAVEGSVKAIVKIYPSSFSQLVEGLDGIFAQPYGCFEQTSSTTYPNVLALDYLRQTKKNVPAVEAKARQYIHLGYQRLLGFEVAGGGFDWFGHAPAKLTLSAYGLMEFEDMARVHDVDPRVIERTRAWLLGQQAADGSWSPAERMLHGDPTQGERLRTTAYVGWAVFERQPRSVQSQRTLDWLLGQRPESIDDPYALALVANALAAISDSPTAGRPYVERLESMKRTSPDGKLAWWKQAPDGRTTFYGAGPSGSIETTALAAMALIRSGQSPATARAALAWLAGQKDGRGTWHSTQATVLALKALLAGTGRPLGGDKERRVDIALDGKALRTVTIPADQGDVVQQIDVSTLLAEGTHRVGLVDRTDTGAGYQVDFRYHVPGDAKPADNEPLSIRLQYDKTELAVDDVVTATASVTNRTGAAAPMVILDLPIPAGFAVEPDDLAQLVAGGRIAKYQVTPRSAIVYLRQLAPGEPLVLRYRLRATMPVKIAAPPARAYEYYNPDKQASTPAVRLTVTAR